MVQGFPPAKVETLVHDLSGDKTLQLSCRGSHGDLRLTVRIWLGLHSRLRKAAIQITPAHKRPPVIEKNFEGPPVCDPAQDQETLFHQALEWKLNQISAYHMRGSEACDQNRNADRERTAANAKKLIEVTLEKPKYRAKASPSSRAAFV